MSYNPKSNRMVNRKPLAQKMTQPALIWCSPDHQGPKLVQSFSPDDIEIAD